MALKVADMEPKTASFDKKRCCGRPPRFSTTALNGKTSPPSVDSCYRTPGYNSNSASWSSLNLSLLGPYFSSPI